MNDAGFRPLPEYEPPAQAHVGVGDPRQHEAASSTPSAAEEHVRGIHGVEDALALLDRLTEQAVDEDDVQDFEISRAIVAGLRDEVRVLRAVVGELARVVVRDAAGSAGVAAGGPARLVMALSELGVESPAPEGEVEFVAGRHPVLGQALWELRGG